MSHVSARHADRSDDIQCGVRVAQQRARPKRPARRPARQRRADEAEADVALARLAGDHRPDIELGEHERCRLQCIEGGPSVARRVERQVVGEVDVE